MRAGETLAESVPGGGWKVVGRGRGLFGFFFFFPLFLPRILSRCKMHGLDRYAGRNKREGGTMKLLLLLSEPEAATFEDGFDGLGTSGGGGGGGVVRGGEGGAESQKKTTRSSGSERRAERRMTATAQEKQGPGGSGGSEGGEERKVRVRVRGRGGMEKIRSEPSKAAVRGTMCYYFPPRFPPTHGVASLAI